MMCRAPTEQDAAMPHLSVVGPKLAMTDAATGDSYPVREHEAVERHPRPAGRSDPHGQGLRLPAHRAERLRNGPRAERAHADASLSSLT
jgi:hypothetical protein